MRGEAIVAKTDTIYGILARADDEKAVKKLYAIRHRGLQKPSIILVADSADIPSLTEKERALYDMLNSETPTTIIVDVQDEYLPHLPRGEGGRTLAFRSVSSNSHLQSLTQKVGPLIAPSANIEGLPPATTIAEARQYFGSNVAAYVDEGRAENNLPSRIIQLVDGKIKTIRA